jgi:hypothetical protein
MHIVTKLTKTIPVFQAVHHFLDLRAPDLIHKTDEKGEKLVGRGF